MNHLSFMTPHNRSKRNQSKQSKPQEMTPFCFGSVAASKTEDALSVLSTDFLVCYGVLAS